MEKTPKISVVGFRPIRSEMAGTNTPKIANPAPNAAITKLIVAWRKLFSINKEDWTKYIESHNIDHEKTKNDDG